MPKLRILLLILTIAFVLRLGAAAYWHSRAIDAGVLFRLGDSDGYWHLATQLARGLPYEYGSRDASIFRAPLLPLVLAPCTLISPESLGVFVARVLGCCFGTAAVWLVMRLASRLADQRSAILAGAIAAVYPSGIGMSITVLSEMLMVPLLIVYLLLWQNAWRADSWRQVITWGLGTGAVAGLAVLARPSCLLLLPFVTLLGLILGGRRAANASNGLAIRPRWKHLTIGVLSILGLSVCMAPWWVRNAVITGRFVPTTLQVGASLLDGLHPGASGASDEGMAFMRDVEIEQRRLDASSPTPPRSTFEYRINQLALQQAVKFAVENPAEVMRLGLVKLARTWTPWPDGGELNSNAMRLAISCGTFSVLLLALWGNCLLWRSEGWWLAICWMPCLYFTLLHMVFVSSIRYREPAVFVLIAIAGVGCADLMRRLAPAKR